MAVISKENLVKFLISKHIDECKQAISPIKLQKAMYFLFAFYGGKIKLLNLQKDADKKDIQLFTPCFEAWAYGPVDREIYYKFKNDEYKDIDVTNNYLEGLSEFDKGFILDMTESIFNTSDFGLVNLSHKDISWKSNFDYDNPNKSSKISSEAIIDEYFEKIFNEQ